MVSRTPFPWTFRQIPPLKPSPGEYSTVTLQSVPTSVNFPTDTDSLREGSTTVLWRQETYNRPLESRRSTSEEVSQRTHRSLVPSTEEVSLMSLSLSFSVSTTTTTTIKKGQRRWRKDTLYKLISGTVPEESINMYLTSNIIQKKGTLRYPYLTLKRERERERKDLRDIPKPFISSL